MVMILKKFLKGVGALCGCRAGYYQFVIDSRFLSCSYSMIFATDADPGKSSPSATLTPQQCLSCTQLVSYDVIFITLNEAVSMDNYRRELIGV